MTDLEKQVYKIKDRLNAAKVEANNALTELVKNEVIRCMRANRNIEWFRVHEWSEGPHFYAVDNEELEFDDDRLNPADVALLNLVEGLDNHARGEFAEVGYIDLDIRRTKRGHVTLDDVIYLENYPQED